jgi:outer membrane biosynthesis protein TonB
MTDIFTALGLDTSGGSFEFVEPEEVDPNDKMEIIEKLHALGLPISHDYLYEQFGIEKPDNYNELMKKQEPIPAPAQDPKPKEEPEPEPTPKEKKKFSNLLSGFFADALGKGALDW